VLNSENWWDHFPSLRRLDQETRRRLVAESRALRLPKGAQVFGFGQTPEGYLLLIEGSVRVQQVSENGREIVLYRVAPGESCALTTICLLSEESYQAEAVAETDCLAIAIPRATFDRLVAESADFRRFVFSAFSSRLVDLLRVIEEIAFARLDVRLAQRLISLGAADRRVMLTHQQLAAELGTAREVVSRQLQEFQRRGWIAATRGTIELVDLAALERRAAGVGD
jgi:CRP/FNR family transcriptional regulator